LCASVGVPAPVRGVSLSSATLTPLAVSHSVPGGASVATVVWAVSLTDVDVVTWAAAGLLAALALVCALAALGLPVERVGRIGVEIAEGLLFLVVGADLLAWAVGESPEDPLTHVGYVVAAVAVIPILTRRPPTEETPEPASMWVLAIAAATVAVVLWRLAATR